MLNLLPPSDLQAVLRARDMDRQHYSSLPGTVAACAPTADNKGCSRRAFLSLAGAALFSFGADSAQAKVPQPLVFGPEASAGGSTSSAASAQGNMQLPEASAEPLKLGEIPADFWYRPRVLKLKREGLPGTIDVVYWQDGQLVAQGYWQACSILRDMRANVMTTIDPSLLDILCGVQGYYSAWKWPHSMVITSGFRTAATNLALVKGKEKAAFNSMHLYGKAADLYLPGIPAKDIGALGVHLAQGGVGFYPSRGFTHLDTGKLRVWKG